MKIGVTTLQAKCADQGLDWEDVLDQRKREHDKMQELGLLDDYVVAGNNLGVQVEDDANDSIIPPNNNE